MKSLQHWMLTCGYFVLFFLKRLQRASQLLTHPAQISSSNSKAHIHSLDTSVHPCICTQSQWGRQLGSSRTLFPGGLVPAPFCSSPCSEMARLKPRPWLLMVPRCHLQMSPFSMSWMCCTMRLIATGERRVICQAFMLEKLAEKHLC